MVFQTKARSDHVPDEVVMRWPRPWHVVSVMAPDDPIIYKGWTPCVDWCVEQFGDQGIDGCWGYVGEGVFEFREEKHAAWFLLRWQ